MSRACIELSDVIALCSLVVAICALVLTLMQIRATMKHNRLMVQPHLSIHREDYSDYCSFSLVNNGVGPAIIEEFSINIDGKSLPGFTDDPYELALRAMKVDVDYSFYTLSIGEHVPQNGNLTLFSVDPREKGYKAEDIDRIVKLLKFKIRYTSIYRNQSHVYEGNT